MITILVIAVSIAIAAWVTIENDRVEVTEYPIVSDRLPGSFSGFRIAQISDLHNAQYGTNNERLLTALSKARVDMIVVTGDLVDSRRTDIAAALDFCEAAVKIAPVYYVTGNHEARLAEYDSLENGLTEAGVMVLRSKSDTIHRDGECITLFGVDDPSFHTNYLFGNAAEVMYAALRELQTVSDGYTVLLSHRPELYAEYVRAGMDLVFTGHAHGGQFRLPFLGGVYAPNQGFFPKYDAGVFEYGNTCMVVSRGIGNSIIPFRMNNPPEIVIAELIASS